MNSFHPNHSTTAADMEMEIRYEPLERSYRILSYYYDKMEIRYVHMTKWLIDRQTILPYRIFLKMKEFRAVKNGDKIQKQSKNPYYVVKKYT